MIFASHRLKKWLLALLAMAFSPIIACAYGSPDDGWDSPTPDDTPEDGAVRSD